jgi:hypothetical protein
MAQALELIVCVHQELHSCKKLMSLLTLNKKFSGFRSLCTTFML